MSDKQSEITNRQAEASEKQAQASEKQTEASEKQRQASQKQTEVSDDKLGQSEPTPPIDSVPAETRSWEANLAAIVKELAPLISEAVTVIESLAGGLTAKDVKGPGTHE